MSECSIFPCRPDQSIDRCLTPLFRNGPIFECEVREVCFNGLSDPCVRSYLWKMLLRCYPFQPSQGEKAKETNKSNYLQFVDEFIVNRNRRCGKENSMILPNPIRLLMEKTRSNRISWDEQRESMVSRFW